MKMSNPKIKKRSRLVASYLVITVMMVFFLGPFVWILITSLQPEDVLASKPPRIDFQRFSLQHYWTLFSSSDFINALKTTAITTLVSTVLVMVLASFGAYAVARFKFPGKSVFLFGSLSMQLGPAIAFLIPLFIIMQTIHLIDTKFGLTLVFTVFTAPVAMWLMLGFFESVPKELDDAALIDGCSRMGILYHITLPLIRPGLIASGIVVFISIWGDLLIPLTLTVSEATTLTVFASSFAGIYEINYSGAAATAVTSALPIVLLTVLFRKNLIEGLIEGAVKG